MNLGPTGIPVPVVGQPVEEEDHGVARATLTPSNISLVNQTQDLASLNPLNIARLKAKQQSAAALSELLNSCIGDLSEKLGLADGSSTKVALHTLAAAFVAATVGGDIGSAALAGALSEIANGALQDVLKADPNLTPEPKSAITQWVAALVGAAAGGQAGAAAALDNVNYNFLTHQQVSDLRDELKSCESMSDPTSCKAAVSAKYSKRDFEQDRKLDACRTSECVKKLLGDLNENPRLAYLDFLGLQELGVGEPLAQRLLAYQVMERWLTGDATPFEQRIMDVAAGVGYCEDHGGSEGCSATGQARKYFSETVTAITYTLLGFSQLSPNSSGGGPKNNLSNQYTDILSPESRRHILFGDRPGSGGHMWPGQPGKTIFPKNWSVDKIIHEIGDIATSPSTKWYAQTGTGGIYTSKGDPAKWVAFETRDGVRIRVVFEPASGKVVTGLPDNGVMPNYKSVR